MWTEPLYFLFIIEKFTYEFSLDFLHLKIIVNIYLQQNYISLLDLIHILPSTYQSIFSTLKKCKFFLVLGIGFRALCIWVRQGKKKASVSSLKEEQN